MGGAGSGKRGQRSERGHGREPWRKPRRRMAWGFGSVLHRRHDLTIQ
jgi:hypothetical protein